MKTSWQTETGSLECRWSETGQSLRLADPWIQNDSGVMDASCTPSIPDFASHSPLGSGEWFAPWNMRWSLPRRT
jgi:hypothetical protein